MLLRAMIMTILLFVAACGGDAAPGSAGTGAMAEKAVADVDAAMADAQRSRVAAPAAAPQTSENRPK